jgi:hypothetical protein
MLVAAGAEDLVRRREDALTPLLGAQAPAWSGLGRVRYLVTASSGRRRACRSSHGLVPSPAVERVEQPQQLRASAASIDGGFGASTAGRAPRPALERVADRRSPLPRTIRMAAVGRVLRRRRSRASVLLSVAAGVDRTTPLFRTSATDPGLRGSRWRAGMCRCRRRSVAAVVGIRSGSPAPQAVALVGDARRGRVCPGAVPGDHRCSPWARRPFAFSIAFATRHASDPASRGRDRDRRELERRLAAAPSLRDLAHSVSAIGVSRRMTYRAAPRPGRRRSRT